MIWVYEIFNVSEKRLFLKVKDWAFASGIAKIALINFREEKIPLKIRDKVIENIHDSRIILDILKPPGSILQRMRQNVQYA